MRRVLVFATAVALLVSGCGEDSAAKPTLTVSAAASLKNAFTTCAAQFDQATVRFSFAGSDQLAAQIRQGAAPNLFASANTRLPDQLHAEGTLEQPQVFATNTLVIAVPKDSGIASIDDLARSGTTVVIGDARVPVGSYTRTVLDQLPAAQRTAITANVRSREPDVNGIVGKLTQGAADAGFTYVTDVVGTKGALRAVALPAALQPTVAYGAGIVTGSGSQKASQAFLDDVISGPCRQVMRHAGFGPPPS